MRQFHKNISDQDVFFRDQFSTGNHTRDTEIKSVWFLLLWH